VVLIASSEGKQILNKKSNSPSAVMRPTSPIPMPHSQYIFSLSIPNSGSPPEALSPPDIGSCLAKVMVGFWNPKRIAVFAKEATHIILAVS
jgi:hypothetical protein